MIIFDHEVYIDVCSNWGVKDREGDFYFYFNLFQFVVHSSGFGFEFCNFGINIYWY